MIRFTPARAASLLILSLVVFILVMDWQRSACEERLHEWAKLGNLGSIRWAAWFGANLDEQNKRGRTPLHVAAAAGHDDVVAFLLRRGASARIADQESQLPIHLAAWSSKTQVFKRLVGHHGFRLARDDEFRTLLIYAAGRGHNDLLDSLLDKGMDANLTSGKNSETALHRAVRGDQTRAVSILLAYDADPDLKDGRGRSPLDIAIRRGNANIVAQLSAKTKRTNVQQLVYFDAIQKNQLDKLRELIASEVDVNVADKVGNRMLHLAAQLEDPTALQLLVQVPDIKVDALNNKKNTPLHVAVRAGHIANVKALLQAGANVNQNDNTGHPPLLIALAWCEQPSLVPLVELLLDHGAEAKAAGCWNDNALHWAARFGRLEILKMMLARGVAINQRDYIGRPPLMWAVEQSMYPRQLDVPVEKHKQVVQTLIAAGAKLDYLDEDGRSALAIAKREGKRELAALLSQAAKATGK